MDNGTYFQLHDNLFPKQAKARRAKWRKNNRLRNNATAKLRMRRFRARRK